MFCFHCCEHKIFCYACQIGRQSNKTIHDLKGASINFKGNLYLFFEGVFEFVYQKITNDFFVVSIFEGVFF